MARRLPGLQATVECAKRLALESSSIGIRADSLLAALSVQPEIVGLFQSRSLSPSILRDKAGQIAWSDLDKSPLNSGVSQDVLMCIAIAGINAANRNQSADPIDLLGGVLNGPLWLRAVLQDCIPNRVAFLEAMQWRGSPPQSTYDESATEHRLVFHNDDFTAFEFVTDAMVEVLGLTHDAAADLAQTINARGVVCWGRMPLDKAQHAATEMVARARARQFPWAVTVRPVAPP